jgi:hypothetical protein
MGEVLGDGWMIHFNFFSEFVDKRVELSLFRSDKENSDTCTYIDYTNVDSV